MPNYVYAAFRVRGDPGELQRFKRTMFRPVTNADTGALARTTTIFDFNGVIPMPADAESYEAWAVQNWGTKWNAFDLDIRVSDDLIWFQFTTAWSFPTTIFEALATEYPALIFSGSAYEEQGEFELTGEFNGADDWGPGKLEWITDSDDSDDDDAD